MRIIFSDKNGNQWDIDGIQELTITDSRVNSQQIIEPEHDDQIAPDDFGDLDMMGYFGIEES